MFERPLDKFSPEKRDPLVFPDAEENTRNDELESDSEGSESGPRPVPEVIDIIASGGRVEPARENWDQGEARVEHEEAQTGINGLNRFLGIKE